MKTITLLALISMSGCATIQEHPYATSFAVAFIAGSIAASTQHDNRISPHGSATIQPVNCANPAMCQ